MLVIRALGVDKDIYNPEFEHFLKEFDKARALFFFCFFNWTKSIVQV